MPTFSNGQGTLLINVAAGSTLVIRDMSGSHSVSGSYASREDASKSVGPGFIVYGPQPLPAEVSLTTTGVVEYSIVAGDVTPPNGPLFFDGVSIISTSGEAVGVATGVVGPSATVFDDTTTLQAFIDSLSSIAVAAKRVYRIVFPPNQTYRVSGLFLRSNLDIDFNGSTLLKTANFSGSNIATSNTTAVLRTGPWQQTNGSFYGLADNITVRNVTLDENNKWSLAAMCLFNVRNFKAHNVTMICGQWNPQWALRGTGYAKFFNCTVLGQSRLFQDAFHWQAGSVKFIGCHAEGGDDCYPGGSDAVTGSPNYDDEPLSAYHVIGCTGISTRGAFTKIYRPATPAFSGSGYTKTRYVRGVRISGSGKSGLLRNGGVSVFDHSTVNNRTIGDLDDVEINVTLDIGTDGTAVWSATSGTLIGSPTSVTQANPPVVTLNNHGLTAGKVVHFMPAIGGMHDLNNFYQVRANNLTANTFELSENPYVTSALPGSGFAAWTTGQLFLASSGSGYKVGEDLTLAGGTFNRPAVYRIQQVGPNGEVEAVRRIDEGDYSVLPPSPNTPTGGSGTGAQLWLELVHNGINAFGSHMVNARNAKVSGRLNINDTTGSATRFRSFEHTDSEGSEFNAIVPKVPALGGLVYGESNKQMSRRNKVGGHMICNGALSGSLSPVMLHNSEGTEVKGLTIDELPSNTIGIQFPAGGGIGTTHNIASISAANPAAFEAAHPGWKKGDFVEIISNTTSAGSLNGYYKIGNTFGSTTLYLKTLAGADVSLAGATVTAAGQIRLVNNTAKIEGVKVNEAAGATGTIGVDAYASARVSRLVIADCDLSGTDTAVGTNVSSAPCGYVARDNKT